MLGGHFISMIPSLPINPSGLVARYGLLLWTNNPAGSIFSFMVFWNAFRPTDSFLIPYLGRTFYKNSNIYTYYYKINKIKINYKPSRTSLESII